MGGRSAKGLFLELVVIFVGVLGAFFAEDARQQREDDRRAEHIYRALQGELEAFLERVPLVIDEIDGKLVRWEEARAAGERPIPPHYREPRAEAPPTAIWAATLASGGVALLEPELFNDLAGFYNRLESAIDRYRRYNVTTESHVLPNASLGAEAYYGPDGSLLGVYRIHLQLLQELVTELGVLAEEGRLILVRVAEASDAQPRPRGEAGRGPAPGSP